MGGLSFCSITDVEQPASSNFLDPSFEDEQARLLRGSPHPIEQHTGVEARVAASLWPPSSVPLAEGPVSCELYATSWHPHIAFA